MHNIDEGRHRIKLSHFQILFTDSSKQIGKSCLISYFAWFNTDFPWLHLLSLTQHLEQITSHHLFYDNLTQKSKVEKQEQWNRTTCCATRTTLDI